MKFSDIIGINMSNAYILLLPIIYWTGGPNRDHHESVTPSLSQNVRLAIYSLVFADPHPSSPFLVQLFSSQKVLMEFRLCHGKASEIVRGKESC